MKNLHTHSNLTRPFALSGHRCTILGHQDGSFKREGFHISGEMSGIWTHPLKIADGWWMAVSNTSPSSHGYHPRMYRWLPPASTFTLAENGSWYEHTYNTTICTINQKVFPALDAGGLGSEWHFRPYVQPDTHPDQAQVFDRNSTGKLFVTLLVRFNILPVWYSGWPDPLFHLAESTQNGIIVHAVTPVEVPDRFGRWTAALSWNGENEENIRNTEKGRNTGNGKNSAPNGISFTQQREPSLSEMGDKGISCYLQYEFDLAQTPEPIIHIALAGSHLNETTAVQTASSIISNFESILSDRIREYQRITENQTILKSHNASFDKAFYWAKMNLEWLMLYSPELGALGASGGLPEFPWYFGVDIELSIPGLLAAGFHEEAKSSLRILASVGKKMYGRIPHEIVTTGNVYSWGHVMETTLFVRGVFLTWKWTGDDELLNELYPTCRAGILDYVLTQPRIDDIIMLEYEDLPDSRREKMNPAFIAIGLEALAVMAEYLHDQASADTAATAYETILHQIENRFWVEEEGLYATVLDNNDTPHTHFRGGFWPYCSGALETAFCRAGKPERIQRTLDILEGPDYSSEWGLYLHADKTHTMPISTGMAAIAEFNYGRTDQGFRYLDQIAKSLGYIMPGAFPEYLHPSGKHELYPAGSCFLQLWSAAMLIEGTVWGFLQPEPELWKGQVTFTPRLPEGWETVHFENLRFGSSRYHITIQKDSAVKTVLIEGPELNLRFL
jgi:hypothetical protein